jgi:hypothetical protein
MQEIASYLIGDLGVAKFVAAFIFAIVGVVLSLLWSTTVRNPASPRSPEHFSWNFFWNDNTIRILKSIISTVLTVFISIRFMNDLIGIEFSMASCVLVGLFQDQVVLLIKKKKENFTTNKP